MKNFYIQLFLISTMCKLVYAECPRITPEQFRNENGLYKFNNLEIGGIKWTLERDSGLSMIEMRCLRLDSVRAKGAQDLRVLVSSGPYKEIMCEYSYQGPQYSYPYYLIIKTDPTTKTEFRLINQFAWDGIWVDYGRPSGNAICKVTAESRCGFLSISTADNSTPKSDLPPGAPGGPSFPPNE